MKFLLDQDVYTGTLRFLQQLGYDAIPVAQLGLSRASDTDLLKKAQELKRIFVTRDRDFGGLVFVGELVLQRNVGDFRPYLMVSFNIEPLYLIVKTRHYSVASVLQRNFGNL